MDRLRPLYLSGLWDPLHLWVPSGLLYLLRPWDLLHLLRLLYLSGLWDLSHPWDR